MKKSFIMLAVLSIGMIACNNEDEKSDNPSRPGTEEPTSPAVQDDATCTLNIIDDASAPFDSAACIGSLTADERKISQALQNFSFQFMADAFAMQADSPSVVVSPYSLSQVVGMLANGAEGQSLEELAGVLNVDAADLQLMNACNRKTANTLAAADTSMTMTEANAVWLQYDFPIYRSFVDDMHNYFDAEVQAIDFRSPAAGQTINKWCAKKTRERIDRIVEDGPLSFVTILANALYVKGQWTIPFDEQTTREQTFMPEKSKPVSVMMMGQKAYLRYAKNETCELAAMEMGKMGRFEIIFGLPRQGVSLKDCLAALNAESWNDMTSSMESRGVALEVPRFETSCQTDVRALLEERGLKAIFDKDKADFSHMSPLQMWIDKVEQKTFLRFDEKGCEAAAVTWAGMLGTTALKDKEPEWITFRLDRPFFFIMREKKSGTILFMGCINKL